LAKEFKAEIVQSHSNSGMGLIGHMVKKKLKIPHVLLIELISSYNTNIHTKTIYYFEKFFLHKLNYDKLIVWTELMRDKFLIPWGIPLKKIEVIPAAIELRNYNLNASGKNIRKEFGENLITSIKSLWKSNVLGLKYIIKAMKIVHKEHPEFKYIIFGWGSERKKLQEEVKKLGLTKVVELPGAIMPEKCPEVWAATKIAPHSFVYEFSTSISLLECMAFGKACVVTDIGGVKEFVGDAALRVKPYSVKAMAEGINLLIENTELRKELEKKARKRVEERHSIKATVDKLEKIYCELLNRKAKERG
jgi:glycosyltransferase involved in cell wall biosynthesis